MNKAQRMLLNSWIGLEVRVMNGITGKLQSFDSETGSELFSYKPDPLTINIEENRLEDIITPDQTTLIDVILSREPCLTTLNSFNSFFIMKFRVISPTSNTKLSIFY